MSSCKVSLIVYISCLTGVIGISLEPSPMATCQRYSSLVLNCSVSKMCNALAFNIDNANIAFLISTNDKCINYANPAPGLYQTSCDFITLKFYLTINNVTEDYNGKIIECNCGTEVARTTLHVQFPPRGVSLTPNGTITKTESGTQAFQCFAKSLPISSLSWQLSGSILPTPSPPVNTTDTVTGTYTYIAQKDDNGKKLSCTAVYGSTSFTEEALINVLYRPIVAVSPNNSPFRVLENTTNLLLTCIVTDGNPAVTSFTWKKDDSMIPGTAIYTIPKVSRSHAGSYTCGATNSVGSSDPSTAIQLEVLYGADITTISKKEPGEGKRLVITCNGQSYPSMTDNDVTWTKQNNNTFIMRGKQLVIENVNRVDSGTFVCYVVIKLIPTVGQPINVTGMTTVEVDVLYRPSIKISPNYAQYKVIENTTNLELDCTVVAAKPVVMTYKWYKDGSLMNVFTDAMYTISTVQRSHTGSYTCDATNSVGTSDLSSAVQLNVLYISDINRINKQKPTESTQLSVSCNVISYPEVTNNDVTWTKHNNATFFKKGQQLVILNVQRIDSGTYICSVVFKLIPTIGQPVNYTRATTVEVDVLYRPTVTVFPDFNTYNVIENSTNLQLTCKVIEANPAATSYRWYKESSKISNTSIYTMLTVHRSQTGNYTCAATNIVGTSISSSVLQLNILYGVELNPISKKNQSEGNQLIITSTGQSYPLMTRSDVKWIKQNNNTFSRVGQQLVIDSVNRVDTGTYVCSVALQLTPSLGHPVNVTRSITVEVDILYRPDVTVSPVRNPYKVIENTTSFHLTCSVTDANPAVTSYRWYKDGVKVSTAATFSIPKVYRSHTGRYTCDASNAVGSSDPSSVLQLNVLYGVSLILSGTEINIDESDRLELSCIGDGNPLPNIACVYGYNGTTVGEQTETGINIVVDHANCVDTGYYICSGINTIGEPVSQSVEIKVACKPRTYDNLDKEDIFMRTTDESVNISTTFISFPLSHISWSRELSDGQLADLDSSFKSFTISSHLPYETIAILQKDQLKPNDFGVYFVNASNIYGSFLMKYNLIKKRYPIQPSYVYVVCKSTTAIVILKPILNENLPQDLYIQYAVEGQNMSPIKVHMNDANQLIEYTVTGLNPGKKYNFSIIAVNPFAETRSNQVECLTETYMSALKEDNSGMFSAGIASLVIGLLFFVAATIFIFRKRFRKTYTKSSKSDEYSDLQTSNPAFQDPYTSLQNPIESRHHQESSANTYEECGNASDAAAYQNIENMKSGHKKAEKNMGIYDNMKI